jgi:quercetin dioxygenase-like cupin family protein
MSYPEPRYFGEPGEVSATLRAAGEPPELTYKSGGTCHYLAKGEGTGGEFGLYRWEMVPNQGGPDPHFHRTISESFYILDGTVRLYNGSEWIDASAGEFLYVPEGGLHGFRNDSDAPASMLLLFTPGAPREEYFETLNEVGRGKTMTEQEWAEFYDRHDTYWR